MMPKSQTQLSITLPRSFTFHYTEGPKTPEQPIEPSIPSSPPARAPYRVKRRSRRSISSFLQSHDTASFASSQDTPIPSIELQNPVDSSLPSAPCPSIPLDHVSAPPTIRASSVLPKTPEPQVSRLSRWNTHYDIGESITRPLSVCSIVSDSSANSDKSLVSYPTGDGSCTSPESDVPDPFRFSSVKRAKGRKLASLMHNLGPCEVNTETKSSRTLWSAEMDRHLWSTYLRYIQDPTVTPFKMLPGIPPPLGVCHRVAREARKTWRWGVGNTPTLLSPNHSHRSGHAKTTTGALEHYSQNPNLAAKNHPSPVGPFAMPWPKSGSSTRRRLRHLCKVKPSIAPHYQRLIQTRTPSPSTSASTASPRPRSSLSGPCTVPSFGTRDFHISLAVSTSDTMQPHGPLAKLSSRSGSVEHPASHGWFNEPPVPFASEIPIPSDISLDSRDSESSKDATGETRLGSPFGYHTWGPSQSRQHRTDTDETHSRDRVLLRSPLALHEIFSQSSIPKRRARHQSEHDIIPNGRDMWHDGTVRPFANQTEGRFRRLRSRGLSLGDANRQTRLETLFASPEGSRLPEGGSATPSTRLLSSPFQHLPPRTPRRSPGHAPTLSLGPYDGSFFSTINETIERANGEGDVGEL